MITLKDDNCIWDISLKEVLPVDTKANILECFKLIHVQVAKNYKKDILAEIYDYYFHKNTSQVIDYLPREEFRLLTELLELPQNKYVEYPRNDEKFLFLQKCYLVMTYQTKDIWHLYMTDNIRNTIKKMVKQGLKSYPTIQELHNILEEFTGLKKELILLLTQYDPKHLSKSDRIKLKEAFPVLKKKMETCRNRLRELEPELKKYNTPLEGIFEDMEENLMMVTMAMFGVMEKELVKDCSTKNKDMCKKQKKENINSVIPLNPEYEQDIFTLRAIDTDCNLISTLMDAEAENIRELLEAEDYKEAALNYMQLLKSMCRHFVSDEHYNYFDDMYSPDYTASDITCMFKRYHSEGKLPQSVVDFLNTAWEEIKEEEEAYWNYGIPSEEWKA